MTVPGDTALSFDCYVMLLLLNSTVDKDSVATASGGGRISGSLLKFDEANAKQGVFFINTKDNSETQVSSKLLRNKPGELIFMNPKLAKGTYRVEVRTLLKFKKRMMAGTLPDLVTVSPIVYRIYLLP